MNRCEKETRGVDGQERIGSCSNAFSASTCKPWSALATSVESCGPVLLLPVAEGLFDEREAGDKTGRAARELERDGGGGAHSPRWGNCGQQPIT